MELLPILYALLAAITGVGGGDASNVAARAAISAQAAIQVTGEVTPCAVRERAAATRPWVAIARGFRPSIAMPRLAKAPRLPIFTVAGFANRRE